MFERFARDARDVVFGAIAEAGRRGDRRVGTDHLVIAALTTPSAAEVVGASADDARRAADDLDRGALAAIGVDAAAFGPLGPAVGADRLPFTAGTKTVLRRALALTVADRSRRLEAKHLVQALLERRAPDPAAELLARLRASD
ncbi:Clp protease N-terminal domain-containing protein [Xylanimonas sp. McL0601]|uniref:Clp protease N-terminal domain-containing protein n=1 Tax=Xylanimonas sp. McL0601 TaxID=3414739 RepID=UPI003CF9C70F